jgi:hypothetical protein
LVLSISYLITIACCGRAWNLVSIGRTKRAIETSASPCFSAENRELFQKNRETIEDERQSPRGFSDLDKANNREKTGGAHLVVRRKNKEQIAISYSGAHPCGRQEARR